MSRVDVLAVLDQEVERAEDYDRASGISSPQAKEWRETRAAVAELIEAIESDAVNRAVDSGLGASEWRAFVPAQTAAALARIGGDS